MMDCRHSPTAKQRANPLWKVHVLVDHLNKQAKDMRVNGKWVAIDEQTIGFQGALKKSSDEIVEGMKKSIKRR